MPTAWFEGGVPASGAIDPLGASAHSFRGGGRATWKIYTPPVPREKKVPLAWNSLASPVALGSGTYRFRWNDQLVTRKDAKDGPLVTLPEYFHLVKDNDKKAQWVVVQPKDVPVETGLAEVSFSRPLEDPSKPYVTPDDAESCWKKPGPVAGPFQAHPGHGSVGDKRNLSNPTTYKIPSRNHPLRGGKWVTFDLRAGFACRLSCAARA
ncbi:MAG: hypothetical protein IIC50_08185 [Planctomycetes bacterium]|nr:hypothetical protein [Planctomycetota bacterium]